MNVVKVTNRLLPILILTFWHNVHMWNMQVVLRYILASKRIMNIQEINWFISEHLDTESSEHFQEFFNTIHRSSSVTQMVLTNNDGIRITKTASKRNYLGIVMTTGPEDPIMRVHDRVLRGGHYFMNFVILVKPLEDFAVAERLLGNLHRNNFKNSFVYVSFLNGSSELYEFNTYPKFSINLRRNFLEDLEEQYRKVAYGSLDCYGFKFYTPLGLDLPGVFRYINKQNKIQEQGIAFRTLDLFTKYTNSSLIPYQRACDNLSNEVVNMRDTMDLIRSKKILISAHAYALFNPDEEIDKSYSLLLVRWCLMVPIRNTVSSFYYPVKPFDESVWYMLFFTFLLLAFIDGWLNVWESRKKSKPRRNLFLQLHTSVLDSLCYMLNMAASKRIIQPSRLRFLLYTSVFFHAFFVSISYTSLLGSILTVTLFRERINTMEDLLRANLSTMIIDYELEFLLAQNLDLPQDFLKLITPVDPATFYLHQTTFNQSYAYFVTDEKWQFLRRQQNNLKPGLFKLTDICFGTFHWAFPMETDSPIWRKLRYFILRVQSSGLLDYYEKTAFEHAIRAGYMQRFTSNNDYYAAGLSHMSMIFLMLLIMGVVSVFIFLGEILYHSLSKPKVG